ncbi:MAG: hypothetical protein P8Y23_15220, partial [Candidatus Lokiarchaeota archaeon]
MINRKLKEDWSKLLQINSIINNTEIPEDIKEIITIPFTPLKVNAHLLYYLLQYLYPKFVNDQKNVLDIIISDYDIDNIAFNAFLYNTKRLGIYDSVQSIPKDLISFKQKELDNLEELFINIQSSILEVKNIRIASIRFFRKRSIDLINRYYEKLEKCTTFEFLTNLSDLIQKLVKEELVIIYPEPNILNFLKSMFLLIGNIKLSDIIREALNIVPEFNQSLVFHSTKSDFTFYFQKSNSHSTPHLELALSELNLDQNPLSYRFNKKSFKDQNASEFIILHFEPLIEYLLEVSELDFPSDKEKLKLLLQKTLYTFTCIGTHWNITPRPKIYNTLIRYLIRIIGFNFNLKHISYWAIPDFIYYFADTYLGLNYKMLFLLTDHDEPKRLISLTFQNGVPIEISVFNDESEKEIKSLSSLWTNLTRKYGFHAILLKIDIELVRKFIDTFLFNFNKIGLFSLLSIMKMIKKSKYFE